MTLFGDNIKSSFNVVQVQAVLEHGLEEYNKDFPRLKITLYEVKFFQFLPFLPVPNNSLIIVTGQKFMFL